MQDAYTRLIAFLKTAPVAFEVLEHTPVFTMDDVARVLDVPEAARVKSLVLKALIDDEWKPILCGVTAKGRLSIPAVSSHLGLSRSRLKTVSPSEVETLLGVPRGAVGLVIPDKSPRLILSKQFQDQAVLYFGAGRNDRTLRMPIDSLLAISDVEFSDIEQED